MIVRYPLNVEKGTHFLAMSPYLLLLIILISHNSTFVGSP